MDVRRVMGWLTVLTGVLLVGCGGPDPAANLEKDPEVKNIEQAITAITDMATRDSIFPELWAGGQVPDKAQRTRYADAAFSLVGDPEVSGDTATATVAIVEGEGEPREVQWTLVKEGATWKLKSAPLQ